MKENLVSFISNLKADKRISSYDEAATKNGIILPLLSTLGWNPFNIDEVKPEYSVGTQSVDYCLRIGDANKVFLEVKRIDEDLENHQGQLLSYAFQEGVKLACLTNGITWWFYLALQEGSWEQRRFYAIDILQQEPEDIASKFIDFLSKGKLESGEAIDNAENVYKGKQRQNILRETVPKAWNRIVSEPDELLIDLINETTEKLCGYKADAKTIERFFSTNKEQFLIYGTPQARVVPRPPKKRRAAIETRPPTEYLGKTITGFTFQNSDYKVRFWRDLLVKLSEILYRAHKNEFKKVLSLKGRKRNYFSYDQGELKDPKKVPSSSIFVETNLSANTIVKICDLLLLTFGYSKRDLKIQFH